jgi:transcriptional regulator GlxA family with amidase domain
MVISAMALSPAKLKVAILAVPEVTASTLYGMFDLFAGAGRDWSFLVRGKAGEPRMVPFVVAANRTGFHATNQIWIRPDYGLSDAPKPDIVCVPDFFVMPGESCEERFDPEIAWLRQCYAEGAMLATACSGAVLLAEAGLLNGREATIHWGYTESLAANYSGVKVNAARSLILDGEEHRIIMAGGGTSWQDLALYLIARFVGLKEAIEVARVNLIAWHDIGQQPNKCSRPAIFP